MLPPSVILPLNEVSDTGKTVKGITLLQRVVGIATVEETTSLAGKEKTTWEAPGVSWTLIFPKKAGIVTVVPPDVKELVTAF